MNSDQIPENAAADPRPLYNLLTVEEAIAIDAAIQHARSTDCAKRLGRVSRQRLAMLEVRRRSEAAATLRTAKGAHISSDLLPIVRDMIHVAVTEVANSESLDTLGSSQQFARCVGKRLLGPADKRDSPGDVAFWLLVADCVCEWFVEQARLRARAFETHEQVNKESTVTAEDRHTYWSVSPCEDPERDNVYALRTYAGRGSAEIASMTGLSVDDVRQAVNVVEQRVEEAIRVSSYKADEQ